MGKGVQSGGKKTEKALQSDEKGTEKRREEQEKWRKEKWSICIYKNHVRMHISRREKGGKRAEKGREGREK
jgi:hypothetical protein